VVGKYGCNSFGLSLGAAFIKHQGPWSLWVFHPNFRSGLDGSFEETSGLERFWVEKCDWKLQGVLFLRLERIVFCKSLEGLCAQRH